MEVVVSKRDMQAILGTRKTLSPGGAGVRLGVSRQRVMDLYKHKRNDRGYLAWKQPVRTRLGLERHYVYVDFGPFEQIEMDPKEWYGKDPQEILAECRRKYAESWAEEIRASG